LIELNTSCDDKNHTPHHITTSPQMSNLSPESGIMREYFSLQDEYERKYGPKTVVLYTLGSFLDCFEYMPSEDTNPNPERSTPIGHATEVAAILNITLTSRDTGKPHSLANPLMAGLPTIAYEKHKQVLLDHHYTIVRIDQEKTGTGKAAKIDRYVGEIVSAATDLEGSSSVTPTNHLVSIYLEQQRGAKRCEDIIMIAGMSCMDVSTGRNVVAEAYSKEDDQVTAIQEVYRFLVAHQPREVILTINSPQAAAYTNYAKETLELGRYPNVVIQTEIKPDFLKAVYQQQILTKIFTSEPNPFGTMSPRNQVNLREQARNLVSGLNPNPNPRLKVLGLEGSDQPTVVKINHFSILEDLHLERLHYGTISYILMLYYCSTHNEKIIQKLQKPDTTWTDESKHLILTHNAIPQLNLLPDSSSRKGKAYDSLLTVVDSTSTALGRRFLRTMLLNPITDSDQLELYYNMTQELLDQPELLNWLDNMLRKLPDFERLHRKLNLDIIRPRELALLCRSYLSLVEIHARIQGSSCQSLHKLLLAPEIKTRYNACLEEVMTQIDLEKLTESSLAKVERPTGSEMVLEFNDIFLREGVDVETDRLRCAMQSYESQLQMICEHLNGCLNGSRGKMVELTTPKKRKTADTAETTGIGLYTSPSRASTFKMMSTTINQELCGKLEFATIRKDLVMITSDKIAPLCTELDAVQTALEKHLYVQYLRILSAIQKYNFFWAVNRLVATLDFVKSNARTSSRHKYYRPTIVRDAPTSFVEFEDLRHPIIERLIQAEYIGNNVALGKDPQGILLYGCNSSGKSSLTKSIGLNLIMAQAGLFTAGKIRFAPYRQLITRLSGHDDLFKGQSSFVVEMMELRTILRNTNAHTMVLGDELSRGSESLSASSLTVATIEALVQRKSSFIFSTHLHNLPEMTEVKSLPPGALRICNLSTTYDEKLETLIYDRKLQDGSGSSLYGIEVAKYLGIDRKFIERANTIRQGLITTGNIFSTKKSRYNNKVYVDACSLCQRKMNLQTHHIHEQHEADEKGFIGNFHKDSTFNLVVLCDECHKKLHKEKKRIEIKQTVNGSVLTLEPDPEPHHH
jgi:DNA mismatch repair protein MutS